MTIGSWNPDTAAEQAPQEPELNTLKRFIRILEETNAGHVDTLHQALGEDELQRFAALMQLPRSSWQSPAEQLDNRELLSLIRFFTLAEQLPGWQSGEKSPVIALAKVLKQRGKPLDHDTLGWIKAHSDNRYLPYGPLLG